MKLISVEDCSIVEIEFYSKRYEKRVKRQCFITYYEKDWCFSLQSEQGDCFTYFYKDNLGWGNINNSLDIVFTRFIKTKDMNKLWLSTTAK